MGLCGEYSPLEQPISRICIRICGIVGFFFFFSFFFSGKMYTVCDVLTCYRVGFFVVDVLVDWCKYSKKKEE